MARLLCPGPHTSALAALLLLLSAAPGFAQTRLYVLFNGDTGDQCRPTDCEPGRVLEIDVDGQRFQNVTAILHARYAASGPVVTPDGRYLLWNGTELSAGAPSFLTLFETSTRQQVPLQATSNSGWPVPLLGHPSAMRVFFQPELSHAISVAEPGGTHTLPIPCVDGIVNSISGDGSRLFVQCRATPVTPSRIVAVDSSSGVAIYKEIEGAVRLAPNDPGTELYTAGSGGNQPVVFRRYDVDSGARLAEHISAVGDTGRGSMLFDSRTGHFFADAHDAVLVLDGVTLEAIARINSPIPGAAARFVLDPDRPAMYVIWTAVRSTGGYQHRIALIDSTTFATLAEADLPTDSGVVGLVLGPRPPRATNLSAAVLGISVMLQWENEASRSLATGVIVEAGSTRGATNLAWFCLPAGTTTLPVPNVPRGTYYVRVRGLNGTGKGEPSNEVAVAVP